MDNEDYSYHSISAECLKVQFEKWEQLLIIMQENGYIKGLVLTNNMEDNFQHIAEPIRPKITLKGLEYLADNGFMGKVKEALKMAGEIL